MKPIALLLMLWESAEQSLCSARKKERVSKLFINGLGVITSTYKPLRGVADRKHFKTLHVSRLDSQKAK